ncbi:MAG: ATP synthase F1 subunit delta [Gemmatimonadota bacterium]|nr:MAG: ATP synthase F1 subunit delta [Gemmatimonadota bacterium]
MQETTVARSYAEALLELALADDAVEVYAEELGQMVHLLETQEDFRLFLDTPRVEPADKKQVLREVFEGKIPDRLLRFLLVVVDKRRQRVLPEICREFTELVNEHLGRLQVDVTTATEPGAALKADIKKRLDSYFGKDVLPRFRTNPRIIGGVVVRVGDRVMDGSIRHRLQTLRRSLLKTDVG